MHNFIRVSSTMPKFRESNDPIPRKHPDRQHEGRTDILFQRVLPATAGSLTSKTEVDWYLKVKDVRYDVGLTKNYCINSAYKKSAQFIHSFF